jgi:hypothetical protein
MSSVKFTLSLKGEINFWWPSWVLYGNMLVEGFSCFEGLALMLLLWWRPNKHFGIHYMVHRMNIVVQSKSSIQWFPNWKISFNYYMGTFLAFENVILNSQNLLEFWKQRNESFSKCENEAGLTCWHLWINRLGKSTRFSLLNGNK